MSENVKTKKRNFFVTMFIPNRSDNIGAIIRKIVVLAAFTVAIVCAVLVLTDFTTRKADENMNEDIREKLELNASGSFSISPQKVDEVKQ